MSETYACDMCHETVVKDDGYRQAILANIPDEFKSTYQITTVGYRCDNCFEQEEQERKQRMRKLQQEWREEVERKETFARKMIAWYDSGQRTYSKELAGLLFESAERWFDRPEGPIGFRYVDEQIAKEKDPKWTYLDLHALAMIIHHAAHPNNDYIASFLKKLLAKIPREWIHSNVRLEPAVGSWAYLPDGKYIELRKRVDGKGDPWANAHRFMLDEKDWMTDFDGFYAADENGTRLEYSEDRLFSEYACSRGCREFFAFFDRKKSRPSVLDKSATHRLETYAGLCYNLGKGQQIVKPKLFYVYGTSLDEWQIEEVDVISRKRSGELHNLNRLYSWQPVWDLLGLTALRQRADEQVRRQNTK